MIRLLRFLFASLVAIAGLTSECSPIFAYSLEGGNWLQFGFTSPVTLTYSYQNMFEHQNPLVPDPENPGALKRPGLYMPNKQRLPDSVIRASIEEALRLWASVVPIHFVEVPDDTLGYGPSTQHGELRFRHVFINGPDPVVGNPIAKAQAYYPFNGVPYRGDVEFDHSDPWLPSGTLHEPDVLGAAIHEIGHTLGLGHTGLFNSDGTTPNMYWVFHRFQGPGTGKLFPDDIAGIRAIYGPGVGSVTPLLIPEPATLTIVTIFLGCLFTSRKRA